MVRDTDRVRNKVSLRVRMGIWETFAMGWCILRNAEF